MTSNISGKPNNRKTAFILSGILLGSITAGVWAIETRSEFGPWLADTVRGAIGPAAVARGEEYYYAVLDHINSWRYAGKSPANMWNHKTAHVAVATPTPAAIELKVTEPKIVASATMPSTTIAPITTPVTTTPVTTIAATTTPALPAFRPTDFPPPLADLASPDDGQWESWEAGPQGSEPLLYRTQVHTDPKRPQSVAAVIAMDLKRLELHAVSGVHEPQTNTLPTSERTGLVPAEDRPALVAAFNGGWQTIHGHLGMKLGKVELLPPVPSACNVAAMQDGSLRIASWPVMKPDYDTVRWLRQTPPCLVEDGKENPGLDNEHMRWGAALNGRTVVRRSAIGLNADGSILYYAVGDSMTSAAITRALKAAGAVSAAMLDINQAFPRFVTFQTTPMVKEWLDHLPAEPLPPVGVYLDTPANKDFFYVRLRQ